MTQNAWRRDARPLVIAHRGHSLDAPENTIDAFRRAIELDADMIETDVNMTRDGVLVIIHDSSLDRTTSGHGPVRGADLAEIRALDAGSWFGPAWTDARVPTTEEVLELARDAGIQMCFEVKGGNAGEAEAIAVALAELLAARDALDRAVVSGYDHRALAAARRHVPAVILAPERLPDDVPAVPHDAVRQAAALGAPVIQNHHTLLTRELVEELHAAGIAVWSWPTTTPDSIASSIVVSADGVMGDDVAAMVRAVRGPSADAVTAPERAPRA
jgi:glycerophosphoryl diester phosphodiesterase